MLHLQHSGFVFVIFGKYQNYFFFGLVLLYKKRLIFCEAVFFKRFVHNIHAINLRSPVEFGI